MYQLTVCLVLLYSGDSFFDIEPGRGASHSDPPTQHYTMIFNAFVFMQVCRQSNPIVIPSIA
jgi:Ca2+ transporting ATPase